MAWFMSMTMYVFGDNLEDAPYLLTMDSKGTKEWYDDEILVIWRSVS